MVGIKFLTPNPFIMDTSLVEHVGKEMWFPDYVKSALKTRLLEEAPDMLVDIEFFEIPKPRYSGQPLDGKTIAFCRSGGAGDLLMIGPSIRRLKDLYPSCHTIIVTSKKYMPIAELMPFVDEVLPFPIMPEAHKDIDYWVSYEDSIEGANRDARALHGVDLFAKLTPIDLGDTPRVAEIEIPEQVASAMQKFLGQFVKKNKIDKLVAVQFRSSNINRSFDPAKMITIIASLANDPSIGIVVIGGKRKAKTQDGKIVNERDCPVEFYIGDKTKGKKHPRVLNLTGETSWAEMAAIISMSDLVIGTDSSALHIAGSLCVPIVGIFGPFPPDIRLRYYSDCASIVSEAKCAPCFAHGPHPCSRARSKKNLVAPCWDEITAEMVVDKAKEMLNIKLEVAT